MFFTRRCCEFGGRRKKKKNDEASKTAMGMVGINGTFFGGAIGAGVYEYNEL